jgi:hypothetical protein
LASQINCFCMSIFERCKPAIFAEFQESISEGFFVWAGEWWLLQLQDSCARAYTFGKVRTRKISLDHLDRTR